MVALAGAFAQHHSGTSEVVAVLIGSSIALWLAHSYSRALALQLHHARYLNKQEIWGVLREQLAVVAVVPIPIVLIVLAEAGLFTVTTALRLSAWSGIAILFVAGATVARQVTSSRLWMTLGGLANAALGFLIIVLETIFAH